MVAVMMQGDVGKSVQDHSRQDRGAGPASTEDPERRRGASDARGQGFRRTAATARYAVLNLIRWSILAGMLVFLLTAILALHEALNFQDRVLELAGKDRDHARRVLGVLHDTLENPDSYPEPTG